MLSWRITNRVLLFLGAAIPGSYFAVLSALSSGGASNPAARDIAIWQVAVLTEALTSRRAVFALTVIFLLWALAVWFTDWMDRKRAREGARKRELAQRADTCAQAILRLRNLHRQREAVAMQHSWQTGADRDFFTSSASLMGDYSILFSIEALSILQQAKDRGYPLEKYDISGAEHPTNPLGVEAVAHSLALLAERLRGL